MTDRIPLAQLTKSALDALYDELDALRTVARGYCPACGRGDAAPSVDDWEQQKQRADDAEKSVARVRATTTRMRSITRTWEPAADLIDAALDGNAPAPAATQATEATGPASWLLAGSRDLSIPRFTARPVTPEMEAAATERAVQAAADSERSAAWFAKHSAPDALTDDIRQQRDQLAADLRYALADHGPRHNHQQPGIWDDTGQPCQHCTRLEQARQHLAALNPPKEATP